MSAMQRLVLLFAIMTTAQAQSPNGGLDGSWQGTLAAGPAKLRLVLSVFKADDGTYLGTLISVDQNGARIPINRIDVTGSSVRLELSAINGSFQGSISEDRKQLTGTWSQAGRATPLEFTRTASMPEPPKPPDTTTAPAPTPAANPLGIPVEMTVPIPPTPFPAAGRTHLVYELHITNFAGVDLPLRRLEVMSEAGVLASFEGTELNTMLMRPGTATIPDNRTITPGTRAIALIWITIDSGKPIPTSVRHRVTGATQIVEGGTIDVSRAKPIVIGPPLRGSDWMATNGPSNISIHRRAMIPINGKALIAQRFAIDWVKLNAAGGMFSGDAADNKNYASYGSEILAVADGIVASTKDGIPQNIPGLTSRAVPITLETIGGNNVILDLGGGHFAFYAHMQPGSLRVKKGDHVHRGEVLGLVGNSGNATGPHLHFHISNSNSALESEGLPYVFDSFEVQTTPGMWERRRNELPLQNARVRFTETTR